MYSAVAKYNGAYAIMDSVTCETEALTKKELLALLYFGVEIKGVGFSVEGDLIETADIPEMTDEDMSDDSDEDDEDEYEDLDYDEYDSEDYQEEEIEDDEDDEEVDEDYDPISESEEDELYDDIYDEDEYIDEDFIERSTVQKLYDYLDPEQVKLLKRYYLWYSQKIFVDAKKDPTLGMKDKNRLMRKKEDLNTLRNTGGMWHYAGFVDMGYDGAGYCTLGHPLRYMHIAWDVSESDIESTFFGENYDKNFEDLIDSNNCITFGIKCISDFFEVDSECTQSLQRAQRESLKDMALMYTQYENGEVNEVVNTFKLMDEVIQRIKRIDAKGAMFGGDNYKPILPHGYLQFYTQFRQSLMPLPKSLIQEIRDNIIGWSSHKFYGSIGYPGSQFTDNLLNLFGGRLDLCKDELVFKSNIFYYSSTWMELVYRYYTQLFTYEICGYFKYDGSRNYDEGGRSQKVREEFEMLYSTQRMNFTSDCEFTMEYADKLADTCRKVELIRESFSKALDDVNRYSSDPNFNLYVKTYKSIDEDDYAIRRYMSRPELFGRNVPYKLQNLDSFPEYLEGVVEDYKKLSEYVGNKIEERKQKEERKRLEEEAEKSKVVTVDEVLEYVRNHPGVVAPSKKYDFHTMLWNDFATKDTLPSKKQQYYINVLYKQITGNDVESGEDKKESYNLDDYPEYERAIRYIVAHGEDSMVRKVCKSVNKYRTFTDKQKHYLDEALALYDAEIK